MLLFYCRDCDSTFESEPDETGYEQARCPACRDLCLTVQFDEDERQRHDKQTTLLSWIGQLTGLFSVRVPDAPNTTPKPSEPPEAEQTMIADAATVCSFDQPGEANACCALLGQSGIDSQLVQIEGTNAFVTNAADRVILQVASTDIEHANRIIDEYRSTKDNSTSVPKQDGHITFECEECGAQITFPAHRHGGVEVCPRCGEYVDVPG